VDRHRDAVGVRQVEGRLEPAGRIAVLGAGEVEARDAQVGAVDDELRHPTSE